MTPFQAAGKRPELVAGLLVTSGLAWWWTVERMAGMDAGPGTALGTLGWSASLAMGARSGGRCIGCSGALMAALFALGVMSLTWMALIAALVALEKTGPWPFAARLATATVLAVLAAGVLAAPHEIPGLAVPGSGGIHAMQAMG